MDGIESLLRLLDDGNWHRITDPAKQLKWSLSRTMRIAEFLSEHGLVHYRKQEESVMLDPELSVLLKET